MSLPLSVPSHMQKLPTVTVRYADGPKDGPVVIINKSDYDEDPDKYVLVKAKPAAKEIADDAGTEEHDQGDTADESTGRSTGRRSTQRRGS